jgi:transcriptional regulator with XRE-family HTH domain
MPTCSIHFCNRPVRAQAQARGGVPLADRRSPSVRVRRLGVELRSLRAGATFTADEAAERLGWSAAKLSRIENGRTTIAASDFRELLDLYQVTDSLRVRLAELRHSANQRGWWNAYDDILRQEYSDLLALEDQAQSEYSYTQLLIPGLLQAEGYASTIISSPDIPPGEIDRRIAVRITRQRVLSRHNALEFIAVLEEACLRRQVGGVEVMRAQLNHLIDMARLPNVTIRAVPFAAGYHRAMAGPFKIIHLGVTDVVFIENLTGDVYIEEEAPVFHYVRAFEGLQELALGHDASVALVKEIVRELR